MVQWSLALTTFFGLVALALVYYIVLFNGAGGFGRVERPASYFDSPFWAGAPHRRLTVALQAVSVTLYLAWVALLTVDPPPTRRAAVEALNLGFLVASMAWPFATYRALATGRRAWMWSASGILWVVAACVVSLMLASPTPRRYLLLPLALLTAVVDGILWTRSALRPPA